MKEWLKRWFTFENSSKLKESIRINGKKHAINSLTHLTLSHLIRPSDIEIFCMQCLLASDRIQSSGLERLTLNNIIINRQGLQTGYVKGRRNKSSGTLLYKRNSLLYETFSRYKSTLLSAQQLINAEEKDLALPYYESTASRHGCISDNTSVLSQHFSIYLRNESHALSDIMIKIGQEAAPIFWLLKKIVSKNIISNKEERNYDAAYKAWKKNRQGIKPIRGTYVKSSRIGLAPEFIAKSRVEMDEHTKISRKSERKENLSESDASIDAELTSHSVKTKRNIYKNRSISPEAIGSMRNFAAQVGEAMEKDAEKLRALKSKTSIVTLEDAKEILGIKNSADDYEELINETLELGGKIGLMGEVKIDSKTVVITTKMTAALIISQIRHIDKEIPLLRLDDDKKAIKALLNKSYLLSILSEYPQVLQEEGSTMADTYEFPFSSLL